MTLIADLIKELFTHMTERNTFEDIDYGNWKNENRHAYTSHILFWLISKNIPNTQTLLVNQI